MGDGALHENVITSTFLFWADREGFDRPCTLGGSEPSEDAGVRFLLMEEPIIYGIGELTRPDEHTRIIPPFCYRRWCHV